MRYYLSGLLVVVIIPVVIIVLYQWLAGGVFNGIAGSWREATVNPDVFLLLINPMLLCLGYALLIYSFLKYKKERKSLLSKILAYLVLVIATAVVAVGVFWKALTT